MKQKIFLIPLLSFAIAAMAETSLVIQPLTGADQATAIASIGKIQFESASVYLYDKAGIELGHTPISDIHKIIFNDPADTPTAIDDVQQNGISIFPNPTTESIVVKGLNANQTIRVYSLNGELLTSSQCSNGEANINVSHLPQGNYLLQVGAEVVKFIKQ